MKRIKQQEQLLIQHSFFVENSSMKHRLESDIIYTTKRGQGRSVEDKQTREKQKQKTKQHIA